MFLKSFFDSEQTKEKESGGKEKPTKTTLVRRSFDSDIQLALTEFLNQTHLRIYFNPIP